LRQAGKTTTAFCGVRSEHVLPLRPGKMPIDPAGRPALCTAEFDAADTPVVIATDDGTVGRQGLVTDVLLHWLHETRIARDTLVVYSCGPEPMMRAVGELCGELGIVCYLSLERNMACGMGTCQSCVVKIRDEAAEADWRYKLCCSDGPVFSAESVIWE
jgi:dihydroorotate dehydrogenase electron transfer subunit